LTGRGGSFRNRVTVSQVRRPPRARRRSHLAIALLPLPLALFALVGSPRTTAAVEQQYSSVLTVRRAGDGSGIVTSQPAGITCGSQCTAQFGTTVRVTLTATPDPGSEFAGWSGDCSGSTPTCSVSMNQNRTVTATFRRIFALTVTRSGRGSVTSAPAGITCGTTCAKTFTAGTSVTLTATPEPDFPFIGWSGACSGATPTCTVVVNAATSVSAQFAVGKVDGLAGSFPGRWRRSLFSGSLAVDGVATGALQLQGTLHFVGKTPASPIRLTLPPDKSFSFSAQEGSFRQLVPLPSTGYFPGDYALSVTGTSGGVPIAPRSATFKMAAPKEGVVWKAWVSTGTGKVVTRAPRKTERLVARFVYAAKPFIGSRVTTSWLLGSRPLGTVKRIRWKPIVVSEVQSPGGLPNGFYTCELRARGIVVYRVTARIG
jgi:hypothetical protein